MPCDKNALLEFLEAINESLAKEITLVAAGGTAMISPSKNRHIKC